jgi:hypothetical protein
MPLSPETPIAHPFIPRRMSVCPVAIHTRTSARIEIIGAAP